VFLKGLLISAICQITFYYFSLYDLRPIGSTQVLLGRLLSAVGTASLLLAALALVCPPIRMKTGVMEAAFFCMVLLILLGRLSLEWANRSFTAGERLLIVGSGNTSIDLSREIRLRSDLPIKILGVVSEPQFPDVIPDLTQLGPLDDLAAIIERQRPDRIVIALHDYRLLPMEPLLRVRTQGVRIEEAATLYAKLTGRIPVESILPSMLIFADGFSRQSATRRILTRVCGMAGAVLGLLLCGPLMLLTALLIKLESPGPVLYRQERVGKDGRLFKILKFRSMRVDAEQHSGPQWARQNDPRITRVGAVIRKLRIDEMPQFVNIMHGDMSFVGPRPERPFFVQTLKQEIPFYDLRHSVRPGISGWAQVSYPYGATVEDAKQKLGFDLFYAKNTSIAFDLAILFQTVKIVLLGRGR
jgi:sugar transferase (PEP-CTERM system associated)